VEAETQRSNEQPATPSLEESYIDLLEPSDAH